MNKQLSRRIALAAPAILFFLFILWIIIKADLGQSSGMVKNLRQVPYGDKFGHFILYGILALLVNLALFNKRVSLFGRPFLLGSLIVGTFAILEEFTQISLASRNFELLDILCDLIGIGLASYTALLLDRWMQSNNPSWSSARSRN